MDELGLWINLLIGAIFGASVSMVWILRAKAGGYADSLTRSFLLRSTLEQIAKKLIHEPSIYAFEVNKMVKDAIIFDNKSLGKGAKE